MPPSHWPLASSSEAIPVRNIYAIGWNYALHNEELNRRRHEPLIIFMKSGGGLLDDGQPLVRPAHSQELHYEGELVVLIGEGGFQISKESAASHVWGYAPGIDFTLRDVQWRVRDQGRPWFPAKCFRGSAAIGPFKAASEVGDVSARRLRLLVNGLPRQDSLISAMNNDVASLVHLISADLPLLRGDAIFTGTPNGVGPCLPGDSVECQIEEVGSVRVKIVA